MPHTPTPWSTTDDVDILGPHGEVVADEVGIWEADDVAFIVHCVNVHNELVAALRGMLDQPEDAASYDAMLARAQAVLAKVALEDGR